MKISEPPFNTNLSRDREFLQGLESLPKTNEFNTANDYYKSNRSKIQQTIDDNSIEFSESAKNIVILQATMKAKTKWLPFDLERRKLC